MNGAQSRLEKTLVELNCQQTPFHGPPSTPGWKDRETFFPRWQHKQLFQSKFQQRRLSLETIGSLMGWSPLSAKGLPARQNATARMCGKLGCPRLRARCPQPQGWAYNLHHNSDLSAGYWKKSPKFTEVILVSVEGAGGSVSHKIQAPATLFCS